jgi:hypothetical protein
MAVGHHVAVPDGAFERGGGTSSELRTLGIPLKDKPLAYISKMRLTILASASFTTRRFPLDSPTATAEYP